MNKKGNIITFKKKATKIVDRTQAEIIKERREKRNKLLNRLKNNKK